MEAGNGVADTRYREFTEDWRFLIYLDPKAMAGVTTVLKSLVELQLARRAEFLLGLQEEQNSMFNNVFMCITISGNDQWDTFPEASAMSSILGLEDKKIQGALESGESDGKWWDLSIVIWFGP